MKSPRLFLPLLIAALLGGGLARADTLIFNDGESLHGTFIRIENGKIIFRSKNVGDISVSEKEARVDVTSVSPPASNTLESPSVAEVADEGSGYNRLLSMGRKVERQLVSWWEPWKGRAAVSLDVINDSKERSVFVLETRARREWKRDEVQVEGRYEHRRENGATTMDLFRVLGNWRHDFGERYFAQYRPELDRDTTSTSLVQPFPYVMLQQQVGVGYHLLKQEHRKLRLGVGESFYNVWALRDAERSSQRTDSAFLEGELQLPWRIMASNRLVLHYAVGSPSLGYENEFEFSKKLTESVSLGIRQEIRKNNPDTRVKDYERLRFLLGYDF